MTDLVQIVAVSVSAALLALVLELVRRRKLTEEYSVLLGPLRGGAARLLDLARCSAPRRASARDLLPSRRPHPRARVLRVRRLALVLGRRLAAAAADRADGRGPRAARSRPARATQPGRDHSVRAGGARFRGPPPRDRTTAARRVTSARTPYSAPRSTRCHRPRQTPRLQNRRQPQVVAGREVDAAWPNAAQSSGRLRDRHARPARSSVSNPAARARRQKSTSSNEEEIGCVEEAGLLQHGPPDQHRASAHRVGAEARRRRVPMQACRSAWLSIRPEATE